MQAPIGISFVVQGSQDAIGVYEDAAGVQVFESDAPYLSSDGKSLQSPVPVFSADGPVYADKLGNARASLAVATGASPEPEDPVPDGSIVSNGVFVSHGGAAVVHTE